MKTPCSNRIHFSVRSIDVDVKWPISRSPYLWFVFFFSLSSMICIFGSLQTNIHRNNDELVFHRYWRKRGNNKQKKTNRTKNLTKNHLLLIIILRFRITRIRWSCTLKVFLCINFVMVVFVWHLAALCVHLVKREKRTPTVNHAHTHTHTSFIDDRLIKSPKWILNTQQNMLSL